MLVVKTGLVAKSSNCFYEIIGRQSSFYTLYFKTVPCTKKCTLIMYVSSLTIYLRCIWPTINYTPWLFFHKSPRFHFQNISFWDQKHTFFKKMDVVCFSYIVVLSQELMVTSTDISMNAKSGLHFIIWKKVVIDFESNETEELVRKNWITEPKEKKIF